MIEFSTVSRWHGDVIALNDLTANIAPGVTTVLGPNGSGKSSLLRLTVGLLRPNQGTVRVFEENPWDNPRLLRRIGYVPEGPSPWPQRTGRDCVQRAAELSGLGAGSAAAASRALRDVGLQAEADRATGAYSHGMTQRLKLAMAWVHEPEVLVLDEPLVGTDPVARADLLAAMAEQARQGRTLLVATHVLADVDTMGGNILLLNHGRLVAHGPVPEIRELLDQAPRTIRITTPDPKALGRTMWDWPSVLSLEADTQSVTVRTRMPSAFHAELQRLGASGGVTSITSPDDSVEAVVQHLVK
ncbi:MAG: ABC transporter ATP-binding protein [Candidatus Thermoplasmatota archaeon]|jgi:ABC-2 type transport system ATP-binding protein